MSSAQRALELRRDDSLRVDGDRSDVGLDGAEVVERSHVGGLLGENHVSRLDEAATDQVDRTGGPVRQADPVQVDVHAGLADKAIGEELSQGFETGAEVVAEGSVRRRKSALQRAAQVVAGNRCSVGHAHAEAHRRRLRLDSGGRAPVRGRALEHSGGLVRELERVASRPASREGLQEVVLHCAQSTSSRGLATRGPARPGARIPP